MAAMGPAPSRSTGTPRQPLMRAAAFHAFGGPEQLQPCELPRPCPGPGEVLVKVAAATVNPTDLMMRSGQQQAAMAQLTPPFIPGMELSGTVYQTGRDARGLPIGQAVMAIVNPRRPEGGAYAEFVRVPAASVVPLPAHAGLVAAATVPLNGLTARMALDALALPPDATLLVTGAAGAVGSYLIPWARQAGLRVIADAKASDADWLQALGAQHLVPRGPDMPQQVRALCPAGIDGLVDAALLGRPAMALVRDGGVAIALRRSDAAPDTRLRHHFISALGEAGNTGMLRQLADAYAQGLLPTRIAMRLPLSQASQAHRLLERGGLRGRIVLIPEQEEPA